MGTPRGTPEDPFPLDDADQTPNQEPVRESRRRRDNATGNEIGTPSGSNPVYPVVRAVAGVVLLAAIGLLVYFGPTLFYSVFTETVDDFEFGVHTVELGGTVGAIEQLRGRKTSASEWIFLYRGKENLEEVNITLTTYSFSSPPDEQKLYWPTWLSGDKRTIQAGKAKYDDMQRVELKGTAKKGTRTVKIEKVIHKRDLQQVR